MKYFKKVPLYIVKVTIGTSMFLAWVWFAMSTSNNWYDMSSWHDFENGYIKHMPDDHPETALVKYVYLAYFAYVVFVFLQDLNASSGQGGFAQVTFTIHHVVTIILVSGSLYHGLWKIGVLFRLIHDPTDMILYSAKIYESYMKVNGAPDSALLPPTFMILAAWVITRILMFGWLTWCTVLYRMGPCNTDPYLISVSFMTTFLAAGVVIMLLLQVVWLLGLLQILQKTIKKGKLVDLNHGD